jgi:hypothetical protein
MGVRLRFRIRVRVRVGVGVRVRIRARIQVRARVRCSFIISLHVFRAADTYSSKMLLNFVESCRLSLELLLAFVRFVPAVSFEEQ